MTRNRLFPVHAVALAALPATAWAHHAMGRELPVTFAQGLLSGLAHPVIGPDHAAFVIAAGFLLALVPRGLWGIAALILGTLLGAVLHLAGTQLPGAEIGIALSVVLFGGLVMVGRGIALRWLAPGLLLAGVLHGHAYAESIFGAEPLPLGAYLIGFCIVQSGVAVAAYIAHRRLAAAGRGWDRRTGYALGAAAGAVGIAFLSLAAS